MNWFNIYGAGIMVIIMIPNIVFGIKYKNIENKYQNKFVEMIEQIGRFGAMFLMVINIPVLSYGYWLVNGDMLYILSNAVLTIMYCLIWILYFHKQTITKAMLLAILPTLIFLISGILRMQILLIIVAIIFGIGHMIITYKNNE